MIAAHLLQATAGATSSASKVSAGTSIRTHNNLLTASLLRYLAVAHFGRGRGNFVESEAPAFWQQEVEAAMALHQSALDEALRVMRVLGAPDTAVANFSALLARVASHILTRLYPEA